MDAQIAPTLVVSQDHEQIGLIGVQTGRQNKRDQTRDDLGKSAHFLHLLPLAELSPYSPRIWFFPIVVEHIVGEQFREAGKRTVTSPGNCLDDADLITGLVGSEMSSNAVTYGQHRILA
jgi:hypothetical protein